MPRGLSRRNRIDFQHLDIPTKAKSNPPFHLGCHAPHRCATLAFIGHSI